MTNIARHPLLQQAYDVCQAIEQCGASPQLTHAVTRASALLAELDKRIPDNAAGMNFGIAIQALKDGNRVARTGWQDGVWLAMAGAESEWRASIAGGGIKDPDWNGYQSFVSIMNDEKYLMPWAPSQNDMLADDWQLVE